VTIITTENYGALCENPTMFKIRVMLFVLIVVCGKAQALDQFERIKCEADIPKSLIGKRDSNERVVVLEKRAQGFGSKRFGWVTASSVCQFVTQPEDRRWPGQE